MGFKLIWKDPLGHKLTELSNFVKVDYSRKDGTCCPLDLWLDPSQFDRELLHLDCWLEPWRQVGDLTPYLDGDAPYFLRDWGYTTDDRGAKLWHLTAYDPLYLLDGTNVAYPSNNQKAIITSAACDDALKALVAENRGSQCDDALWDLSTYLAIEVNKTLAPVITDYRYSRQQLGLALRGLCQYSLAQGTFLTYDIVWNGTKLEFRTYTGQRGINRGFGTKNQLTLSEAHHNLANVSYIERHKDEFNHIYAVAGENNEIVQTAINTTAVGLSPFNRRALYVPGSQDAPDDLLAKATAARDENRARSSFGGKIVDTDGCLYGVDYRFGDQVYITDGVVGFNAHVDYIHVTIEDGKETLGNRAQAEAAING